MGVAIFPVIEFEIAGLDTKVSGKGLANISDGLDLIAASLNVKPLMDFYSQDPDEAAEVLTDESFAEEEIEKMAGILEWSEAADGLKTVRAYLDYLEKNPYQFAQPFLDQAIEDLKDFERILSVAARENVRWYLSMIY